MSPKMGRVEVQVLDVLREARERGVVSLTTAAVIEALYGPEPTRSQGQSLRRALRSLEGKGHIETERLPGGRHKAVRLGRDSAVRGESELPSKFLYGPGSLQALRPDGSYAPLEEVVGQSDDDEDEEEDR